MNLGPPPLFILSVQLRAAIDETAAKNVNVAKHLQRAVPAAHGQNLPLFHLPGFPEDAERCAICDLKLSGNPLLPGAIHSYGLVSSECMAPIALKTPSTY